jgi:hypothetical protein
MTSMLVLWLWEGSLDIFMAGSFIKGAMNKGEYTILSLERVSIDTPQPDGSVVGRGILTWALYNHIPSGIMVLKRTLRLVL